ncbi:MAG: hypothetical protein FWE05_12600 [Defluviitaleaceae bacterium]|nr:hypothetical protein [Defluviitaleaceae bacterium]
MKKKCLAGKMFILMVIGLLISTACARKVHHSKDEFIELFEAYEHLTIRMNYISRFLNRPFLDIGLIIYDTHVEWSDVRVLQVYIAEYLRSEAFMLFAEQHMENVFPYTNQLRVSIILYDANEEHALTIRANGEANFGWGNGFGLHGFNGWSMED